MRALFGGLSLVGLLLAVAIWAYVWSKQTAEVAKTAKEVNPVVNQMAGRSEDGKSAIESITLSEGYLNGQLRSLVVTDIVAGGAMEKMYPDLKKGDRIVEMGDIPVDATGSFDAAKDMLIDRGFKTGADLKVLRGNSNNSIVVTGKPIADQIHLPR